MILDQLPRNAADKVLKHELRAMYGRSAPGGQNGGSSVYPPEPSDAHGSASPPP